MGRDLKERLKRDSASKLGLNLETTGDEESHRWREPEAPDVPGRVQEPVACRLQGNLSHGKKWGFGAPSIFML